MEKVKKISKKTITTKKNILITKVVPINAEDEKVFGWLKRTVRFKKSDIIEPIEENWNVYS